MINIYRLKGNKMGKQTDESILAGMLCAGEGKKSQVKRADVMEIIKLLQKMIKDEVMSDDESKYFVLRTLTKTADKALKKQIK